MRIIALAMVTLLTLSPAAVLSHAMPGSTVKLAPDGDRWRAEVQIPLDELAAAMGRQIPPAAVARDRAVLETYLRDHMELRSGSGLPWGMRIDEFAAARDHDHGLLAASVSFSPPAGVGQGLMLSYDAVMDKVPSHYALVYLKGADGQERPLGRLQPPTTELVVIAAPAPQAAPAQPEGLKLVRPEPVQWVYLAILLAALAIATRGYQLWRRKLAAKDR